SVRMKQGQSGELSRDNALEKARALLVQVGSFGAEPMKENARTPSQEGDDSVSDAVLSARRAQDEAELDQQVDEGLIDTFPASDPVSATYSSTAGANRH
ncbi:MAG: hypothetical protein K0M55_11160, partial [Rhizobium sp.]|nr:hypothetical protein [Rhizobium sp.]